MIKVFVELLLEDEPVPGDQNGLTADVQGQKGSRLVENDATNDRKGYDDCWKDHHAHVNSPFCDLGHSLVCLG